MNRMLSTAKVLITPEAIATELVSPSVELATKRSSRQERSSRSSCGFAEQQFEQGRDPARSYPLIRAAPCIARQGSSGRLAGAPPDRPEPPGSGVLSSGSFHALVFREAPGLFGRRASARLHLRPPDVDEEIAEPSPLGKALYTAYTKDCRLVAVRERRDLLTRYVDEIAAAGGRRRS